MAIHVCGPTNGSINGPAQSMNNPADLINLAVEEVVRERFELPVFRTLDDLVARVRALVNRRVGPRDGSRAEVASGKKQLFSGYEQLRTDPISNTVADELSCTVSAAHSPVLQRIVGQIGHMSLCPSYRHGEPATTADSARHRRR